MLATEISGIRVIPALPSKGKQYLSVHMAELNLSDVVKVADSLGFNPVPVLIDYPVGVPEMHVLLWEGEITDAPSDMNERIDQLANLIPPQAIRSVRGAWTKAA